MRVSKNYQTRWKGNTESREGFVRRSEVGGGKGALGKGNGMDQGSEEGTRGTFPGGVVVQASLEHACDGELGGCRVSSPG